MKQFIKFMAIIVLSAVVGFVVATAVLVDTASEEAFAATYFGVSIFLALVFGAFEVKERTRYESIKHRMGNYRKAA